MLLKEFLKEHRKVERLQATVASLVATVNEQAEQMQKVNDKLELNKVPSGPLPIAPNNKQDKRYETNEEKYLPCTASVSRSAASYFRAPAMPSVAKSVTITGTPVSVLQRFLSVNDGTGNTAMGTNVLASTTTSGPQVAANRH